MKNTVVNTILLLLLALGIGGGGYYLTEVKQPEEMAYIESQYKEAQLRYAEVETLLKQEAATVQQAERAIRRWKSRYKLIPETLQTPDVIHYFESLTRTGFEEIRIGLSGMNRTPDMSYYTFNVAGIAYFNNLHDLVWKLENNRNFYHVRDLKLEHENYTDENPETNVTRSRDMIRFSMVVDAYFGGTMGLSAPAEELVEIPRALLPLSRPAHNSFYPLVRTELPPNDRLLVNVEMAELVSIIGGTATFKDDQGLRELEKGDEVYLGTITEVDPIKAVVKARLNKGGVTEEVEVTISESVEDRQTGLRRRTSLSGN